MFAPAKPFIAAKVNGFNTARLLPAELIILVFASLHLTPKLSTVILNKRYESTR